MATQPKTLAQLQARVHALVSGDTDTPATTDDEWGFRLEYLNDAILEWETEEGVMWRELWVRNSSGGTVADSTQAYAAPTGFKMLGGFIELHKTDSTIEKITVIEAHSRQTHQTSDRVAYVTGNPQDGYEINLNWTPATGDSDIGATIKYDYYKFADELSDSADEIEMSNPAFAIHTAVAQEHLVNDNPDGYTVHGNKAQAALGSMQQQNELKPHWNDPGIEDEAYITDGISFGV